MVECQEYCPKCGDGLVLRNSKGRSFWGHLSKKHWRGQPEYCNYSKRVVKEEVVPVVATKPELNWSEEQRAIIDSMALGKNGPHLICKAFAGTGKTTTISGGAWELPNTLKIGAFAFNKKNSLDLERVMPSYVQCRTWHSLGCNALRAGGIKYGQPQASKVFYIAGEMLPPDEKLGWQRQKTIAAIISLCKQRLIFNPTENDIMELAGRYDIDLPEPEIVIEWVPKVFAESNRRTHTIDFDDMIFLPILLNLPIERFDVLMADESQDLNPARIELLIRSLGADGRAIIIGDENQAIYGFTGADTEAMDTLVSRLAEHSHTY